jgi:sulfur carrier protein
MIKIYLNRESIMVNPADSLADILIKRYNLHDFAVALNRHFIPREQYKKTYLQEGDSVEIISPMQGG